MMISKANMLQHTATGLVLSVTSSGALCVPCPTQTFAALSLLRALSLFLMQRITYLCLLHKRFQADC